MDPVCLAYGAMISFIVSFLKRWSWAKNNPQLLATLVSTAVGIWQVFAHGGASITAQSVGTLATCIVAQLGTSIATHEIVTQRITNALSGALIRPNGS